MQRGHGLIIPLAILLLMIAAPAVALEAAAYRPVRCDVAKAYSGPPLHSPPNAEDLPPAGPIAAPLDAATVAGLDTGLRASLAASPRVVALTASVAAPGRGSWTSTKAAPDAALFHWASAGKMFTAAVVLQLVQEGKLRLDDPIAKWTPTVPNARAITVDHLLNHTSGLFSVNEDLQVRKNPRPLAFDEAVAVMKRHGAMFCPGERWRYTNSGYAILGRIIEEVDGRSYEEAVRARIIAPLRLEQTRVLSVNAPVPADMVPIAGPKDEPQMDPRDPGPAGGVVASAQDMIIFLQAYAGGRLASQTPAGHLLEHAYPMFDGGMFYGRGLMLWDVPDTSRRLYWIGHAGGTPGLSALVAWSPPDKAFVAVALTGEGSSAVFANALLKAYSAIDVPADAVGESGVAY